MENYNPENPAYEPTNNSYNDMIISGIRTACRAGRLPREM